MTAVAAPPPARAGRSAGRSPDLPSLPAATAPPEARGLARDEVRLLVASDRLPRHVLFRDLGAFLDAGDVLVVNTSATLPACVDGRREDGRDVRLHLSTPHGWDRWIVELRDPGAGRVRDGRAGEQIELPSGVVAILRSGYPDELQRAGSRLWVAELPLRVAAGAATDGLAYLRAVGRPIVYDHVAGRWPLSAHQTIFATEPGSAEMPSAGRPFSPGLLADLAARGVVVTPLVLHAGLSSLEAGEQPLPERYRVPAATARLVNEARAAGRRVIAVGTTVTRALETAAAADGTVSAARGWTRLVLGLQRPARVVDGILTGWHDPEGSHVQLLEAVAGEALVGTAHRAAAAERYLAHEFGDACLLLASRDSGAPGESPSR